jgi:Rab-GTPase-TBC domain
LFNKCVNARLSLTSVVRFLCQWKVIANLPLFTRVIYNVVMESEGLFASALRMLSLSPPSQSSSARSATSVTAVTVAETQVESGVDENSLTSAVVLDPVRSALVRGSVRAAGLEWATLEAYDGVLPSRLARCARVLEGPHRIIDADALRSAAWAGLPARYRTAAWQLLLGYLPLARDRAAEAGAGGAGGRSEAEQALLRQVLVDVPRTCPDVAVFHCEWAQRSLERVLFTYAARHFATGYVQGLNDLATPFYAAFLTPWLDPWNAKDVADSTADAAALEDVEADVYWCLCRLLEGIQDHYTPSQPGIQRMIHRLRELVHRIDGE